KHEYVTQNGRVVRDYVTDASTGAYVRCLDFTYDESGHPLTMRRYYNESQTSYNTYHYVLNGQGDVVKLLHGPNKTVAEYTYDAWGNLLSVSPAQSDDPTIAAQNPLRYRGYYYDTETGFYYLQSRYYDPIVKRFINADSYGSTGTGLLGYNMYAYCENNPIVLDDSDGHMGLTIGINNALTDSGDHGGGGGGVVLCAGAVGLYYLAKLVYDSIISPTLFTTVDSTCLASKAFTIQEKKKASAANRPSYKKVSVNMNHILSGHTAGGSRHGPGGNKTNFPWWMTPSMIEKAVREAYKNAEKAGAMQESWWHGMEVVKQCFIGVSETFGVVIELYLNYTTQSVDAAWPIAYR
ncbi:MAG: RHS repeat-associated core domain-containing protein, partial [Clostridia bacterium]|nr:RHS repeat-associated core domain-containing protein [Clostridia bacterium]